MKALSTILFFLITVATYSQPNIPEDRMFLKISYDVVKVQQNIFHPKLDGSKQYRYYISWEYEYKNSIPIAERSFYDKRSSETTETVFFYNSDYKLVKDSTIFTSKPMFNSFTNYEYDSEGRLKKATTSFAQKKGVIRIDTYRKYKSENSYEKVSRFFDDDNKESVKYTSVYENGLKKMVIFAKGFSPFIYQYDTSRMLISRNSGKYYYKLDQRGNPIASVYIERGIKIFDFIKLTYSDGLVTGSLEQDDSFIQEYNNKQ